MEGRVVVRTPSLDRLYHVCSVTGLGLNRTYIGGGRRAELEVWSHPSAIFLRSPVVRSPGSGRGEVDGNSSDGKEDLSLSLPESRTPWRHSQSTNFGRRHWIIVVVVQG